ncbi:MAG TPA: hypothetical protein PK016_00110 [Candidatus Atribacteria bacterium]|nr:hypothetical protein [Candidatus Atribacteria bacterium]
MFLDYWLLEIEKIGEGWLIFLLLGGGIISGFYFFRLKKILFPLLTFVVVLWGGGITRGIEKSNLETLSFSDGKVNFFVFLFLALFLAGVAASKKGEKWGRFFSGFWLAANLYYLLIELSSSVELMRFLQHLSFREVVLFSLISGFLFGNKKVLNLFSSLVGSSLLALAYLQVLSKWGGSDTFWDSSPWVLFLFLVFALWMMAVKESD